jgi:hypothetical protein
MWGAVVAAFYERVHGILVNPKDKDPKAKTIWELCGDGRRLPIQVHQLFRILASQ